MPILKSLAIIDFTVKNTFHIAEKIIDQNSDFFMGSLNVDSLFTNILLDILLLLLNILTLGYLLWITNIE